MKIIDEEHQLIFQSQDEYGGFELRIHKNCSQIQLESGINDDFGGDSNFVNISTVELTKIRDMINIILEN